MISPINARERDFHTPNSEDLDPSEIRIIACGTGMPTPRPSQAAACFLMELGNGDKFIFDTGRIELGIVIAGWSAKPSTPARE